MKKACQKHYLTIELLPGLFITHQLKIQDINFIKSNNIGLIIYHYLDYLAIQPTHPQDPSIKIFQFKYQLIQNTFSPSKLKKCCDQVLKEIENIAQQQMATIIPIQTFCSRSMLITCLIVMTKQQWDLMTILQFLKVKIINFNIQNYYLKLLIIYQRFLKRDKQLKYHNLDSIGFSKISLDLKANPYIRNLYRNHKTNLNNKNSRLISYKSVSRYQNRTQRSQKKVNKPKQQYQCKTITQIQPSIEQKNTYQIIKRLNRYNQNSFLNIRQKVNSYRQVSKINDSSYNQMKNKLNYSLKNSQQLSILKSEAKTKQMYYDLSEGIIDKKYKKYQNLITIIEPIQIKIDKKYRKSNNNQTKLDIIQ